MRMHLKLARATNCPGKSISTLIGGWVALQNIETQRLFRLFRQKGQQDKKYKKTKQRPKKEFNFVTSGQFCTLAMFFFFFTEQNFQTKKSTKLAL